MKYRVQLIDTRWYLTEITVEVPDDCKDHGREAQNIALDMANAEMDWDWEWYDGEPLVAYALGKVED